MRRMAHAEKLRAAAGDISCGCPEILCSIAERDNHRHHRGADDAVENGKYHGLLVGVADQHGQGSVLAGGRRRGDAGVGVAVPGEEGDHKEGSDLPHEIAEEGDAAQAGSRQIADGDTSQAVPAHAPGNGHRLVQGEVQQHAADNASRQGAQDDANRNDQGLQQISPELGQQPPVQPYADAHGKHQKIQQPV